MLASDTIRLGFLIIEGPVYGLFSVLILLPSTIVLDRRPASGSNLTGTARSAVLRRTFLLIAVSYLHRLN